MRIKSFLFMTLLLGLAAAAHGSMITTDPADPACPTSGTYQTLIDTNASGGCSIDLGGGGSLQFSNFVFTPAGVGTPTASGMGYSLDDPGSDLGVPIWGFEFNPGLAVAGNTTTPNAIQDILINYKVVAVGTQQIVSAHLFTNAFGSGGGVGLVTEFLTFCTAADPDPTLGTCHNFPGNPLEVGTATGMSDVRNFGAWTSMEVSKDMNVASIMAGGVASMSQVRDSVDVTVIPEPETWELLALGSLLVGISRFRSRMQKN